MSPDEPPTAAASPSVGPTSTAGDSTVAPTSSPVVVPATDGDLSSLGSRIVRRTTDLIVIAVIIGVALTVTLRIVDWWKADPQSLSTNLEAAFSRDALAPWGAGPGGSQVQFGDAPFTLSRTDFRGPLDAALTRLADRCATVAAAPGGTPLPLIEEPERQLIERLSRETPRRQDVSAGWKMYQLPGPVPMVITVGRGPAADADHERVLCWGLALPFEQQAWNLLLVTPGRANSGASSGAEFALPTDARHGMTVRDEVGGSLTTFSGAGPAAAWKSHFDSLAAAENWVSTAAWRSDATHWSATWTAGRGERRERIDIHLMRTEAGWTGVRQTTPLAGDGETSGP